MPYLENQGIKIHYQVRGQGDPLLLVHGAFVSWKWWRDTGFLRSMRDSYRLIMIDVRGHGKSGKPHDPESYEASLLVSDLVCVLDELGLTKAHYHGYSMGGWIGFAAAKHAPERFSSFILGGIHPYSDLPGHQVNLAHLREQGMEGIVAWFEATGPMTEEQKDELLSNDVEALVALTHNARADYSDLIPNISVPCLLYCGDDDVRYDGAKKCAEALPNAAFVSLAGYDHLAVSFLGTADIVPHISEFLSRTKPT